MLGLEHASGQRGLVVVGPDRHRRLRDDRAVVERRGEVLLAGFMRILGDAFVRRYEGRMMNIHPSLLPAFPGLHTHRRALEAGCKVVGATVHFVPPTLDHGPIVAQATVPVRPDDDEAALAARVLEAEHRLYPLAVRWFVEDKLRPANGIVTHADGAPQLIA